MEYLFRLPDGRRLALWSERNQIVRLISGVGNRSQSVIRSDFLSDLSAAMHDGKIYFVYQNTASMVMLHLPDDEEDILLFGERLESCRHGGLTLVVWQERLYLFYAAWNPVREKYALKLRELPMNRTADGAENGLNSGAQDNGSRPEMEVLRDLETVPAFHLLAEENALSVLLGEDCLRLTRTEAGEECWERGKWLSEEMLDGLRTKMSGLEEERGGLLRQVSELEAERGNLQARLNIFEQEHEILQEQTRELEGGIGGLQEKLKMLTIENRALKESNRVKGEAAVELQNEKAAAEARLTSAVDQYNELAELTRQLQQEGKKWRDRYYQETKKKNTRSGAVKVKRVSETQS